MNAGSNGWTSPRTCLALGLASLVSWSSATAVGQGTQNAAPGRATSVGTAPAAKTAEPTPTLQQVRIPVNPTDPVLIINNQVITRQQLADEAIVQRGKEVAETLIARTLIEQALRAKKLDVSPAEVDQEIDNMAMRMGGVSREVWLRTLDKERGISPARYARDIIYPSIALKKLAAGRVQVTEQDLKDAFDANFGPKLRCRIIMTDSIRKANEIWEEIKKNPGGFEAIAKERSLDTSTRASGGMLPDPIARHAFPRNVSDAAFRQLVDGEKSDLDPNHKPKDGDFTGPIQVNEGAWVIMKRDSLDPGRGQNINDPTIRESLRSQMYDVKLNTAMGELMNDLMKTSAIENRLTGQVKLANEAEHPDSQVDQNVKLMGGQAPPPVKQSRTAPTARTQAAPAVPAGISPEVVESTKAVEQAIKSRPTVTNPK